MAETDYKRSGKTSGVSSGFIDVDKLLGGLHPSDLIILAGRPSMGKTALATNIAFNAAKAYRAVRAADGNLVAEDGAVVGFFSLEMSAEQLATRVLSEPRESGSIEQDAGVGRFVFREKYSLGRTEPMRTPEESAEKLNDRYDRWKNRLEEVHGTGEVIVAKQRHGPIGKVTLRFDGA